MNRPPLAPDIVLWLGDASAYIVITLIGFSSHGTLQSAGFTRILATLLPFYASWILLAVWGGVHRSCMDQHWRWLLGSGTSACLAAPLAATLRSLWLGGPILPTFVLVMAAISALGIMLWRLLFDRLIKPRLMG
jgi:uncharacterized membrane protein YadS